jgi:hypothetical protein
MLGSNGLEDMLNDPVHYPEIYTISTLNTFVLSERLTVSLMTLFTLSAWTELR